ncbi:hypothetical protein J672_2346 [Acinetobacter sp. 883425]|nr:hypothetical protein J672_2346 [Acinetobacter sp. 883425]
MLQWFITLNQRKRLKPVVAQRLKDVWLVELVFRFNKFK